MPEAITLRLADRVLGLLKSPLLQPISNREAINDLLGQANPLWSLDRVKARVVAIIDETADTRTFVLAPNWRWAGHRAGQHVLVEFEIDGVRCQRTYSLSSAPSCRDTISITTKRQPGGKVSNALNDRLRVGDVLTLSPAQGQFILPAPAPPKLLMLSGGSGITPLMSMLRELHATGYRGDIVFLHACRSEHDFIFDGELRRLGAAMPNLTLIPLYQDRDGFLTIDTLQARVPDYARRQALMCGPGPFMDLLQAHWDALGIGAQLQSERFGPVLRAPATGAATSSEVLAARSERAFSARAGQPLLNEAEAAGLKPRYGCRIGICQSCQCRKLSGTVENLLTGKVSSEPGAMIQLCVSTARSDIRLDL